LVAGTSMGGIVGGLWAAGFSADCIRNLARNVDWSGFFSDRPKRSSLFMTQREEGEKHLLTLRFDGLKPTIPTALTAGQKLTSLLNRLSIEANYTCRHDFDRLPTPLRICAVDILTARPVIFRSGNLAEALRATMSVPLAFTPLEIDSMMLMDGGLLMPIPVEVALDAGADIVVAVNTTSGLLDRDRITDPIDIANQTTTIMQLEARDQELAEANIVVSPDLGEHLATDFSNVDSLIAAGESAMMAALPALTAEIDKRHSLSDDTTSIHIDSVVADPILSRNPSIKRLVDMDRSGGGLRVTQIKKAALEMMNSGLVSFISVEHPERSIGWEMRPSATISSDHPSAPTTRSRATSIIYSKSTSAYQSCTVISVMI
jgi:predicted acylesterase/phospholipase RssA